MLLCLNLILKFIFKKYYVVYGNAIQTPFHKKINFFYFFDILMLKIIFFKIKNIIFKNTL